MTACVQQTQPLGSKDNPIKISLVPSHDSEEILKGAQQMKLWLENETGLFFTVNVPVSYVAVVEALGSKKADVAALTTSSYLMAREKFQVEPILMSLVNGKSTYKGQIITHVKGLKKIEDIQGKSFAYVDPASASGHLLAVELFKKKGITPSKFIFAGGHDAVVTLVYTRKADAGATFFSEPENGVPRDARRLVKTQFPDVFEKVKVLGYTDEIANDAFVVRKDFPVVLRDKIVLALEKWIKTPMGLAAFKIIGNGTGFIRAKDSDYDSARKILKSQQ